MLKYNYNGGTSGANYNLNQVHEEDGQIVIGPGGRPKTSSGKHTGMPKNGVNMI